MQIHSGTGNLNGFVPVSLVLQNHQFQSGLAAAGSPVADPSDSSSVDAAAGPSATPPPPDVSMLTPASLLAYCESRLNSLNRQMDTIFAGQQKSSKTTSDLSALASALNNLPATKHNPSPATADVPDPAFQGVLGKYDAAIASAGADTPLGQELTTEKQSFIADCDTSSRSPTIPQDKLSTLVADIKNYTNDVNSDAQLGMINLQSLMSQQQTAIQLTTNLVQALGQQSSDITKNVGT